MISKTRVLMIRKGKEFEVQVEYNYLPGRRGMRDSLGGVRGAGPPLEPDDPPMVDIVYVTDATGEEVELTDAEAEKVQDEILNRD